MTTDLRDLPAHAPTVRTIPYTGGPDGVLPDDEARAELLRTVARDGLAVLRGFPCEGAALVGFGRQFGELEPVDPFMPDPSPDNPMDWLGHTNVAQKKTWGHLLPLHTAAGHAPVEPRLHVMLMLDKGIDQPDPALDNGQTRLARVDDAVRRLRAEQGPAAEDMLRLLETTPISTEYPFPDEPRVEPILRRTGPDSWRFRYWIKIVEFAERTGVPDDALQALRAFDRALNDAQVEFDLPLDSGDLIVVDNYRVAHGRRPFPREVPGADGTPQPTTRAIYNVHVFCEL